MAARRAGPANNLAGPYSSVFVAYLQQSCRTLLQPIMFYAYDVLWCSMHPCFSFSVLLHLETLVRPKRGLEDLHSRNFCWNPSKFKNCGNVEVVHNCSPSKATGAISNKKHLPGGGAAGIGGLLGVRSRSSSHSLHWSPRSPLIHEVLSSPGEQCIGFPALSKPLIVDHSV